VAQDLYREAYGAVRRIGQALLDRRLGAEKPVAILSDNGIDHALLALGAMHVGVPAVPVSPAYSLMSKDFGKLKRSSSSSSRGWCTRPSPKNSGLRSRR
jgi:feruloyl-CoA synthase